MRAGILVIKTLLNKKGFEEGLKDLEKETEAKNVSSKLFEKADQSSKGFLKTIGLVGKQLFKIVGTIGLVGIALAGLIIGAAILYKAFKKAWDQNKQAQADFKYIGFALGEMLNKLAEPLAGKISNGLTGLVQLLYKLLQYINYISVAWFNVNLFENASVKNFKKANAEAQKMNKTMAKFDEMNTVGSKNGNDTTVGAPSFDLSKVPSDKDMEGTWIGWIAKNKELILGTLAGIALGLLILKMLDPSTWVVLAVVALGALVGVIIKNWDKIKETLSKVGQWIWDNVLVHIWNFIKQLWDTIVSWFNTAISVFDGIFTTILGIITAPFKILAETVKGVFDGIKTTIQGVFDVIKGLFTGDWKKVMDGFKQIFKGAFNTLWSIAKAPLNLIIDGINSLIRGANKIKFDVPDWVPFIGGKKFGFNIKPIPRLAQGGIINMPGKGVPLALGGEAGPEGVIPFTNEQQMDLIGKAIAKYLTIDLTNITTLDGRTIARSIKKIQGQNDFAMNR